MAQAQGQLGQAQATLELLTATRDLAEITWQRYKVLTADGAVSRQDGDNQVKQRSAAIDRLRKLAIDAERRHWICWSLEAKLAEWQILTGLGNRAEAAEVRVDLEKDARAFGFKRILSLLNSPRQTAS